MDRLIQHSRIRLAFREGKKGLLRIIPLVFLASCAEEFVPENPLDPENPEYIPPEVTITSGPSEGQIVDSPAITFTWDGNQPSMLYRYKLDTDNWSGWAEEKSVTLDYLDEGSHTFSVQSAYTTGDTSSAASVRFEVDAVTGPALMFYPRRQRAGQGSTVTFQILAEEVTNLTATEFALNYDPTYLEILSISQGSIFEDTGESIFHSEHDNNQGIVSVLTALLGGDNPSVSGTGDLAIIEVNVKKRGTTALVFDGSEVFRDPENDDIFILESIDGLISTP